MKLRLLTSLVLSALVVSSGLRAADKFTITVTQDLAIARPAETITLPWSEVNKMLPKAMIQHIAVKDSKGAILPFQVTNVAPEAKDKDRIGAAYGDLIFQHDFAAGENSATFTVEKIEELTPVFPSKVFARYVPERLDDFAWENDKVAHRTYGPALGAPDTAKRGKEVLVTSGLDVWCKRVSYPVVDRWYNKGHDHYHEDEGEGMDMYNVGASRGCGGTGIWEGEKLYVGRNYAAWKVIANGPVRAIFELSYDAWDAAGTKVSEVKRFTVDAGHNFDQIDSTFGWADEAKPELVVAIGLNKKPSDKGQDPEIEVASNPVNGTLSQWVVEKTNGSVGYAVIVPSPAFQDFAENDTNHLILAKATSGQPVRYYVGAGWSRSGDFPSKEAWDNYLATCAARIKSPVKVSITSEK